MPPRHRKAASETFAFTLNQLHDSHLLNTGSLTGLLNEDADDAIPDELLSLFDSDEDLGASFSRPVPPAPQHPQPVPTNAVFGSSQKKDASNSLPAPNTDDKSRQSKLKELKDLFKEDPEARFCQQTRGNALDPLQLDPKRAKRIVANRQSAHRSRMKKLQYTHDLEKDIVGTNAAALALQPEVQRLSLAHSELVSAAESARTRLAELKAHIAQQEALSDALQAERSNLKAAAQQMLMLKQAQRAASAVGHSNVARVQPGPSHPPIPHPLPQPTAPPQQPLRGMAPHLEVPGHAGHYGSLQAAGGLAHHPTRPDSSRMMSPLLPSDPSLATFGSLNLGCPSTVAPCQPVDHTITSLGPQLGSIPAGLFDDASLSVDSFIDDDLLAGISPLRHNIPMHHATGMPPSSLPQGTAEEVQGMGVMMALPSGLGLQGRGTLQDSPAVAHISGHMAGSMQHDKGCPTAGGMGLQGSIEGGLEGMQSMSDGSCMGLGVGGLLPVPSGPDDLLMMMGDMG